MLPVNVGKLELVGALFVLFSTSFWSIIIIADSISGLPSITAWGDLPMTGTFRAENGWLSAGWGADGWGRLVPRPVVAMLATQGVFCVVVFSVVDDE